jgi:hypothetical protein
MLLAKATFNDLEDYYIKREEELAIETGATHSDMKANLQKVFNNFTDLYNNNVQNSAFGIIDNLVKAREQADRLDRLVNNPQAIRKSIANMVDKMIKELSTGKINTNATFRNESIQLSVSAASFIAHFALMHDIDPEKILVDATNYLVYGTPMKKNNKDVKKFLSELEKAEPSIKKIMSGLQVLSFPSLKEASKTSNKKKGDPRSSIFSLIATKHGIGAEAYITDLLSALIDSKQLQIINALPGVEDVSSDTAGSISDSRFTVQLNKKVMSLGADIKATSSKKKTPGSLKYTRGEFTKNMSEIFEMLDSNTATTMMYLIANSFFYKNKTEENSFERFIGKGREIYALLNAFRALYALIPPNQIVATKIEDVNSIAKTDDRFVVIIDGVVFLMSEFLSAIREQVLEGGRGGNAPIGNVEKNLTAILNAYSSGVGGVQNKLYQDKKDLLNKRFKTVAKRKGTAAYKELYNTLVSPPWGDALQK